MRGVLMTFFCIIACVTNAQSITEEKVTWDYPIRYGTKEWEALKTVEEQFNAYNIPDEIIKKISTEELVKICLAYPEWGLMTAHNSRQTGFFILIRLFNGFRELFNRNDAATELLKVYEKLDPLSIDPNWTTLQQGKYSFQLTKIEMFLCQKRIFDQLEKVGIRNLKETVVLKYQRKKMLPGIYSLWDLSPTVGKCLTIIEKENPELVNSRTDTKMFKYYFMSKDIQFLDTIVELLKEIES